MDITELATKLDHAITKSIANWEKEHSDTQIEKIIKEKLDKNLNQIVIKLLGFDGNYPNEYMLDHCNGRSGDSPIGHRLGNRVEEVIHDWIDTLEIPKMTKSMQKSLQDEFKKRTEYKVKISLEKYVENATTNMVKTITKEIDKTIQTQIDDSLTIKKILIGKNN